MLKLVQQLSKVYQTMRISDFAKLADFLSLHDCEKLIVQAVSNNQVLSRAARRAHILFLPPRVNLFHLAQLLPAP